MKEYKTNEELLEHLISKNVKIPNKEDALKKIEKYFSLFLCYMRHYIFQ